MRPLDVGAAVASRRGTAHELVRSVNVASDTYFPALDLARCPIAVEEVPAGGAAATAQPSVSSIGAKWDPENKSRKAELEDDDRVCKGKTQPDYAAGVAGYTSGIASWTLVSEKDGLNDEHACVGCCAGVVTNGAYTQASQSKEIWVLRCYNGQLYGASGKSYPDGKSPAIKIHQGDVCKFELDIDAGTLHVTVNDGERRILFDCISTEKGPIHPFCCFYGQAAIRITEVSGSAARSRDIVFPAIATARRSAELEDGGTIRDRMGVVDVSTFGDAASAAVRSVSRTKPRTMSRVRPAPKCTQCDGRGVMVAVSGSEKGCYLGYNCDGCEQSGSGERWHCAACRWDFCFECKPRVPAALAEDNSNVALFFRSEAEEEADVSMKLSEYEPSWLGGSGAAHGAAVTGAATGAAPAPAWAEYDVMLPRPGNYRLFAYVDPGQAGAAAAPRLEANGAQVAQFASAVEAAATSEPWPRFSSLALLIGDNESAIAGGDAGGNGDSTAEHHRTAEHPPLVKRELEKLSYGKLNKMCIQFAATVPFAKGKKSRKGKKKGMVAALLATNITKADGTQFGKCATLGAVSKSGSPRSLARMGLRAQLPPGAASAWVSVPCNGECLEDFTVGVWVRNVVSANSWSNGEDKASVAMRLASDPTSRRALSSVGTRSLFSRDGHFSFTVENNKMTLRLIGASGTKREASEASGRKRAPLASSKDPIEWHALGPWVHLAATWRSTNTGAEPDDADDAEIHKLKRVMPKKNTARLFVNGRVVAEETHAEGAPAIASSGHAATSIIVGKEKSGWEKMDGQLCAAIAQPQVWRVALDESNVWRACFHPTQIWREATATSTADDRSGATKETDESLVQPGEDANASRGLALGTADVAGGLLAAYSLESPSPLVSRAEAGGVNAAAAKLAPFGGLDARFEATLCVVRHRTSTSVSTDEDRAKERELDRLRGAWDVEIIVQHRRQVGSVPPSGGFVHGGATVAAPAPAASSASFSFGRGGPGIFGSGAASGTATTVVRSPFGSSAAPPAPPLFGSSPFGSSAAPRAPPSFGGVPPSFGSSPFGSGAAPPAPPSFGSSPFGSSAAPWPATGMTPPAAPSFGGVPPSFGSSTFGSGAAPPAPPSFGSSPFGSSAAPPATPSFSSRPFGSSAASATPAPLPWKDLKVGSRMQCRVIVGDDQCLLWGEMEEVEEVDDGGLSSGEEDVRARPSAPPSFLRTICARKIVRRSGNAVAGVHPTLELEYSPEEAPGTPGWGWVPSAPSPHRQSEAEDGVTLSAAVEQDAAPLVITWTLGTSTRRALQGDTTIEMTWTQQEPAASNVDDSQLGDADEGGAASKLGEEPASGAPQLSAAAFVRPFRQGSGFRWLDAGVHNLRGGVNSLRLGGISSATEGGDGGGCTRVGAFALRPPSEDDDGDAEDIVFLPKDNPGALVAVRSEPSVETSALLRPRTWLAAGDIVAVSEMLVKWSGGSGSKGRMVEFAKLAPPHPHAGRWIVALDKLSLSLEGALFISFLFASILLFAHSILLFALLIAGRCKR